MSHRSQVFANYFEFTKLFTDTMTHGQVIEPRGQKIRELRDTQITIYPQYPFQDFKNRKYNLKYFINEMLWKLGASKYDESIKDHASMWEMVQNPDGTFNSNYGQYWFGQQMGLMKAVMELIRDGDSRRASIPMLRDDHLSPETVDTVCTESITFHIRNNTLYASVHMRSSDQIFGLGTDVPTFSVLMMMALGLLRSVYPTLQLGTMTITAASSHIYERHWGMVERILAEDFSEYQATKLPEPESVGEVMMIFAFRGLPTMMVSDMPLLSFLYE